MKILIDTTCSNFVDFTVLVKLFEQFKRRKNKAEKRMSIILSKYLVIIVYQSRRGKEC